MKPVVENLRAPQIAILGLKTDALSYNQYHHDHNHFPSFPSSLVQRHLSPLLSPPPLLRDWLSAINSLLQLGPQAYFLAGGDGLSTDVLVFFRCLVVAVVYCREFAACHAAGRLLSDGPPRGSALKMAVSFRRLTLFGILLRLLSISRFFAMVVLYNMGATLRG